jgi:hypothetical protein
MVGVSVSVGVTVEAYIKVYQFVIIILEVYPGYFGF